MSEAPGESAVAALLRRASEIPAALSFREKVLVGALAGLLLVAAVLGVVRGLRGYQNDVAARLQTERDSLAELRMLSLQALRPGAGQGTRTLASTLEDLLARSGVRDRVQLNPVAQANAGR